MAQVQKNEELTAIVKIMGLTYGKVYEDVSDLRYGHLMIMADQDHDGSHIKGLIINFMHLFWPSLLQMPGFLLEFVTPIVRVRRDKEVVSFYSTAEFTAWKEKNSMEGWSYKYYKGLGTSTAAEARQYFAALDTHRKEFVYEGAADDYAIDLAFSKRKAEERKVWMTEGKQDAYLDEALKKIPFAEFINKELIQFSFADCKRCIPSIMDGLKPGQRKVLYACFKRDTTTSTRVAQLAGFVSETAFYHHGECSLQNTIVGMAQTFVGARNINLLEPEGQFGTRLDGGRDSASPRYIFTKLSPLTRTLLNPADDGLIKYLAEDEASIEPEWYIPIIPMSLVNGSEGIGTGWSTCIPNFNPRDVVENVRRMMRKEPLEQMTPWYRDYKGTIEWSAAKDSFVSNAVWRRVDDENLEITELPVHYWTNTYKEYLESLVTAGKVKVRTVNRGLVFVLTVQKSFENNSSDTSVHFTIVISVKEKSDEDLVKDLRLQTKISLRNMHLYNAEGKIKKYEKPEDIIEEFYPIRVQFYEKRKEAIVDAQIQYLKRLENKLKFIEYVGEGKLTIFRRMREDVMSDLIKFGFDPMTNDESGSKPDQAKEKAVSSFDYLLAMPISSMTLEDIEALELEFKTKKWEHEEVLQRMPEQIWEADLTQFLAALEVLDYYQVAVNLKLIVYLGIRARSRGQAEAQTQKENQLTVNRKNYTGSTFGQTFWQITKRFLVPPNTFCYAI